MTIKNIFLLTITCVFLMQACKKNHHLTSFEGGNKIFFAPNEASDSLLYSFANFPAADSKELSLPVKIMGAVDDTDRIANVSVDAANSTALPSEYELGNIVVPAGSSVGHLNIKLFNTARLETEQARLVLNLEESDDFSVEPVKPGKVNELVKFTVIWTNELIPIPTTEWPSGWGGYSKAKHRLVIDLTGYYVYSRFSFQPMNQVVGICNQWLEEYNATHAEPFKDENGNIVRFCSTCP